MNLKSIIYSKTNTNQAFWLGLGSLSSFTLGIVSAAILSRYLPKSEYGTYRQILYVYSSLLVVFTAGLPRVFSYFLPRYSVAQGKDIVLKISKVLFLMGLFFSFVLFVFSGLFASILKNPELRIGLRYFSPVPMLLLPTLGMEGIFSAYKKTIYIALYNTLTRFLTLSFIVLPVIIFKGTYLYAIFGWTAVSILTFIIAYYFKGIPFKNINYAKSDLSFNEILKFSLPIALASIAGIAIKAADQFYISRFFGTEVFAEFSNGFIELPFIHMITSATSAVLMPQFSKLIFDKSDKSQLLLLWQNALEKSAIIIYPLVIYFIFYSKEIIYILFSDKYLNSSTYFVIALFINFFNIIVFTPLLLALGETNYYARLHLFFAFISWIGGYFIVLIFNNPLAVAAFASIRTIMIVIIALSFTSQRINVRFYKLFPLIKLINVLLPSLIAILLVKTFLVRYFNLSNIYFFVIVTFTLFIIFLICFSYFFKINYRNLFSPVLK